MKTIINLIVVVMLCPSQQAQAVFFEWSDSYDGGGVDKSLHVMTDASSDAYLTGITSLPGGNKIISSAYTANGTLLWQRTANTFVPGTVKQVERDNALNTFVLCEISTFAYTLIRYNSNAVEMWRHNYSNYIVGFRVGNPSAVYICELTPAGVTMSRLMKNNGAVKWTRSYPDPSLLDQKYLSDFTIDNKSNLYFSGTTYGGADDYRIVKLSKNGNLIYNVQYDAGNNYDEETYKITASDAGELYIVGDYDTEFPGRTFYHLVKFSAVGVHEWHTRFEASVANIYFPMKVQVGPDGNPVVVGTDEDFFNINPVGETWRIEVNKFNGVTGELLYSVFPSDPDLTNLDIREKSNCMVIDAANDIYIGGSSNLYAGAGVGPDHWIAEKINGATGEREWVEAGVLSDPENEIASIAVTSSNESYLAGTENISGTPDIESIKYCEVGCIGSRLATSTEQIDNLSVYPNPSNDHFLVTNNTGVPFTISVYETTGMLVEEKTSSASELAFGENLPTGVYIIKFTSEKEVKTMRIIKS